MTQPHAHPPAIEAAQSDAVTCRSKAADDFRKRQWLWEIFLAGAILMLGGAVLLFALAVLGFGPTQLPIEKAFAAAALTALFGGMLLYVCRDRLSQLRNASNANLTSLTEAEGLHKLQLAAINGASAEVINTGAQSIVALTRGPPMDPGTTNQTLEIARMEGKIAPKPADTALTPAAIIAQLLDMRAKQNEHHNDADVEAKKDQAGGDKRN